MFAVGSLLCVLAPTFPLLVLARIIQAAGGAAIPGLGMTIATRAYPQSQVGGVGLMSTGVGVAQAIGSTLGGTLASALVLRQRGYRFPFIPRELLSSAPFPAVCANPVWVPGEPPRRPAR